MNSSSNTNQKGVTLAELILVIGIISILATTMLLVLEPEEKKARARDGKRIGDIESLDRIVNEYLLDNGVYPDLFDVLRDSTTLPGTSSALDNVVSGWIAQDFSPYISHLPIDPINDATYRYYYYQDINGYELNAVLETLLDQAQNDGGDDPLRYEMGNNLELISP